MKVQDAPKEVSYCILCWLHANMATVVIANLFYCCKSTPILTDLCSSHLSDAAPELRTVAMFGKLAYNIS
jgi:hypothetical protein